MGIVALGSEAHNIATALKEPLQPSKSLDPPGCGFSSYLECPQQQPGLVHNVLEPVFWDGPS